MQGGLRTERHPTKKSTPGQPLVSIITVCLNSERYLEQTIQSVLNQTYENIEYIIIDGGSRDDTVRIIKKYEDRIDYWSSENDDGMYDALNKGHNIAEGDYVLCLNADDYLSDAHAIERIINLGLGRGKKPLLIVGQMQMAFGDEILDCIWPTSTGAIQRYNPEHPATLISNKIYKRTFYNPSFKIAGDVELWFRLRTKGFFQFKFVPSIVSIHRLGGISTRGKTEYSKYWEVEIARYFNYKKFSYFKLIRNLFWTFMKKLFTAVWGERNCYKYLDCSVYLFRERFFLKKHESL